MRPTYTFILGPLFGAIFSFGFPSFLGGPTPLLALAGYAGWYYQFRYKEKAWLHSWLFALGFNLTGFYWIPHTLQEFGELPWWLAQFLGIFFSFIILPQLWAINLLRSLLKKYQRAPQGALFWASFFFLFEQLIPQQFPTHLGHTLLPLGKWLGLAPIIGEPGYSFLALYATFSVVEFFQEKRKPILATALFLGAIVLGCFFPLKQFESKDSPLHLRLVQANVGNLLKLASEDGHQMSVYQVINLYKNLSLAPYQVEEKTSPELIVWPETAYPLGFNFKQQEKQLPLTSLFEEIAQQTKAQIFFGGYDETTPLPGNPVGFETDFNSGFHLGAKGEPLQAYHKKVLIPFGETLPFGPLNFYLAKIFSNIAFFGSGKEWTVFETTNGRHFISPICYEILLTSLIRDYLNHGQHQAQFIVNLTNDSWYGKTAEPEQHLFLAKWRALEFQMPIVRSTNTGITSVVYPDGSESDRLTIGERRNLDLKIYLSPKKASFYQNWGIWPILALIAALNAAKLLRFFCPKKNKYIVEK